MASSSDVLIRKTRRADRTAIVEMCRESIRETYGPFLDPERMKPWTEGEEAERYVDTMLPGMLVAERDAEQVGVTALKDHLIDLLWVAADQRRTGIGTLLLQAAERELATAGHGRAALECFSDNAPAIRFYEGHGWEIVDRYPDSVAGFDKVLMHKSIGTDS